MGSHGRLADEFNAKFEKQRHDLIAERRKIDTYKSDLQIVEKELSKVRREVDTLSGLDEPLQRRHFTSREKLEAVDIEHRRQIEAIALLRQQKQELIREIKTVEKGKKELEWSIHGDEDVNKELEASAKLLVDKIDVVNGQRRKLRSEMEVHQAQLEEDEQALEDVRDRLIGLKTTAFHSLHASGAANDIMAKHFKV